MIEFEFMFGVEFTAGLFYSILGFMVGMALIVSCKTFKRKGKKMRTKGESK